MKHFLFCIIALLSVPTLASAATLTLTANPAHVGAGDTVELTADLTSEASVNAFSGSLIYPPTMKPVSISDGNSIVNIWIERPAVASGTIRFAGVTPGGFSGSSGTLFSVVFRATSAGTATFSTRDITILRSDGAGTPEPTATSPLVLHIAAAAIGGFVAPADTGAPEPFVPQLGRDPTLSDGKAYLAFTASDKGSGIDHYEVAETRLPSILAALHWQRTESPYVLGDQYLTSTVYVKAVDRAGNARIVVVHRERLLRSYEWGIGGILIVLFALVVWRWQNAWVKRLFPSS